MKYLTNPKKDIEQIESWFGDKWTQKTSLQINQLYRRQQLSQRNIIRKPTTTLEQQKETSQHLELLEKWRNILQNPQKKAALIKEVEQYSRAKHLQAVLDDLLTEPLPKTPNKLKLSRQPEEELLDALLQQPDPHPRAQRTLIRHVQPPAINVQEQLAQPNTNRTQVPPTTHIATNGPLSSNQKERYDLSERLFALRPKHLKEIQNQKDAEAIEEQRLLKRARHGGHKIPRK